jgi:hypothetical protein
MEQAIYYTPAMRRAFHSLTPPTGFAVTIVEHNVEGMGFLEIVADEKQFFRLHDFEKRRAVEYLVQVKKALEDNGAIVQITRRAVK